MSLLIGINIALLHVVIACYAHAFRRNDTVASPGQVPVLRSLRLPIAYEEPPNCLPPAESFQGKNYCWYRLEGDSQVHAGTLIPGTVAGALGIGYVTLELITVNSNPSARDVGVWAEGFTALHLSLDFGIELYLLFSVPRFAKVGGEDAGTAKQLKFPASLLTVVDVPCWGRVAATAEALGVAAVHKTDEFSRLQISLFVDIFSEEKGKWKYQAVVDAEISASVPAADSRSVGDGVHQCPPVDYPSRSTTIYSNEK
ncbi:hypothetical protein FOZ60_008131 [Perkinsus olseni]|uniref:Uncharacterized protein n=1 Tax=Perkinsus olseni TaxID=32597 RepID=A0A7J6NK68_PEROL|nr:hypothetical protein FOZ60_008131 [Perkinsus olseni]KAF4711967.1 hypothetical protein FOZ62_029771 [Perkinsus olseni]